MRPDLRRGLALVALALAVVGVVVAAGFVLVPFDVPAEGDTPVLRCGPAPYELLTGEDPGVPSAEDAGCGAPAARRVLFGGAALALALAVVLAVKRVGRERAVAADIRWLDGRRRSGASTAGR